MGGLRPPGAVGLPTAKREPRLNLGRAGSARPAMRTGSMTGLRDGVGTAFATSSLGGGPAKLRFGRSSLGRSWLGGSLFSGAPSSSQLSSPYGRSPAFSRSASLGRSSPFRHRGNLMRAPGGLGGHTPRFSPNGSWSGARGVRLSRSGALGRLARPLRGSVPPKSPGAGWLRQPAGRNSLTRRTMGRGAFGRGAFGRGAFGRGARRPEQRA